MRNELFTWLNGDSIQLIKDIDSASQHFSIFSPPFVDLYVYSNMVEDLGNCKNVDEFFIHFNFLLPELNRIMIPGRLVAVHSADLPIQKGKHGYIGLNDFSGKLIEQFISNGFIYHSRVTIWKDPVIEMQRTKALGLLHKQLKKDSTMSRVGIPDYLLIFRKEGENPIPVIKQDKDQSLPNYTPVGLWQKYASPVWYDINYSDTLQFRLAREKEDERHICPLQLPTIERAIFLWTNEGENVFTPFGGIASEVYQTVKMNRKGHGIELKKSYFDQGAKNLMSLVEERKQLTLI